MCDFSIIFFITMGHLFNSHTVFELMVSTKLLKFLDIDIEL